MRKAFFSLIFALFIASAFVPNVLCLDEVEIILSGDKQLHDFKNPYDLHNLSTSLLAIMELELLRIGDYLIDFPRLGPEIRPLNRAADWVQTTFRRIPQVKPVSRFGQLMDALQIRQFSLADLRMMPSVLAGGTFRPSPNMQTRFFKLFFLCQDILDDLDQTIMFPVNKIVSRARSEETRVKTLAWIGDGLGQIRKRTFKILKTVNKRVVETASDGIDLIEKGLGEIKARGVNKRAQTWIVYFKMPADFYESERSFFDSKAPEIYVGSPEEWRQQLVSENKSVESLIGQPKRGWRSYSDVSSANEVLIATRLPYLKKAPGLIRDYVIDSDEFDALIYGKPSPRAHLKIAPASI